MAATKIRDRSIPIAEFEMPLADALALLLPANELRQGDDWAIHIVGDRVRLTRERAGVPNQAGAGAQGAGRQ